MSHLYLYSYSVFFLEWYSVSRSVFHSVFHSVFLILFSASLLEMNDCVANGSSSCT